MHRLIQNSLTPVPAQPSEYNSVENSLRTLKELARNLSCDH